MSHWEDSHGLFAYEVATGLLVHQVLTGGMSKLAAIKRIDDARIYLSREKPSRQPLFEQIAAKATAQIEVVVAETDRQMRGK